VVTKRNPNNPPRIMSEYPVKVKLFRNRKKKSKMDGDFADELKPKHTPYHRNHHNYLLDDAEGYEKPEEAEGEWTE